ncbi:hypothetical protein OIDMADRAFT_175524 [Oidiodendron maius Zn]|uniref:Uncharacterized protein n=1 Tax=Oidiodendron maius (strain Zn) TaxID=913774 RepID=A0A0C3DBU1_OIDMZ|nr:hypothetical protein OIDMADRAFT_175524 [Oidiodendron maius Zn]
MILLAIDTVSANGSDTDVSTLRTCEAGLRRRKNLVATKQAFWSVVRWSFEQLCARLYLIQK